MLNVGAAISLFVFFFGIINMHDGWRSQGWRALVPALLSFVFFAAFFGASVWLYGP